MSAEAYGNTKDSVCHCKGITQATLKARAVSMIRGTSVASTHKKPILKGIRGTSMAMKIGEFFKSIGLLTQEQVDFVLLAQQAGDTRRFGEIAVSLRYMEDTSINRFAEFMSDHNSLASGL